MVYILSKNHFSNYSSDYDKKIKELHGQVEKKAKEVQRVSEEKDSLVKEVNILGIRKTNLIKKITELEKQFILSEKKLNNNIKRKTIFIDIAKKDLNKERLIFKEVNQSIKILNEKLFNLNSVSKEIISFILKGKNARKKYLDEQKNIDNAKKEYLSIQKNNVKEKKNINKIKMSRLRPTMPWFRLVPTSFAIGNVMSTVISTDNAIVRFDGITGTIIQNSSVIIADNGDISGV